MWIPLLLLVPQATEPQPRPADVRLVIGPRSLAPVRVEQGAWREQECGSRTLRMTPGAISIHDSVSREATAKVVEGLDTGATWLASADPVAYFARGDREDGHVLRLDASSGTWLDPWVLDDQFLGLDPAPGQGGRVTCVLPERGRVFALRLELVGPRNDLALSAFSVVALDAASGQRLWARRFAGGEARSAPGAVLLAPMRTGPMSFAMRPLQLSPGGLLVCVGGSEGLMLLDPANGASKWSVERPWEFQRGYIGPSMWCHYVDRFGMRLPSRAGVADSAAARTWLEELQSTFEARRKAFDALYLGSVTAGPYVVRKRFQGSESTAYLVVTALAPREDYGAQLAQHFVHEFDGRGDPVSVTALPRGQLGEALLLYDDRVVFACPQGSFACIGPSDGDGRMSMFPGSAPDGVGRLRWFVDPVRKPDHPWLACTLVGDAMALDPRCLVRVADGGRIPEEKHREFEFPLWIVDPEEGGVREATLSVPFDGVVELPKTNYSGYGNTTLVWGSLGVAVTRLAFAGERLEVTLESGSAAWTVSFATAELAR